MVTNIYTTLNDLIRKENPDLLRLFESKQPRHNSPLQLSGILVPENQTSREQARQKMLDLLKVISSNGGDFYGKYQKMNEILQNEGIAKLISLLYQKGKENDDEWVINEFLNPYDQLQSLFRGMPLFKIVVVDARPAREAKTSTRMSNNGRFDIYLKKVVSNERFLIEFPTKESKIMYLWMLCNPRKEMKKSEIDKHHKEEILHICDLCYYGTYFELKDKFERGENKGDRGPFEQFWVQHKSKANNSIENALKGQDMQEWYTIVYDKKKEVSSLSLPANYIELPESLNNLF